MDVIELYNLPTFSDLIENGISLCPVDDGFVLSFQYWNEEDRKYKLVKLSFENVVFFKNESESTCFDPLDSYDRLVELPDSDLLVALAHQAPHFDFTPFHHYAIYFDSAGLYQFIAKNYAIVQEDIDQMEYRAVEESSNNFNAVSFSSLDNVKFYCAGAGNILEMVGKSIEGNIKQVKVVFDFTTYCSYVSDALLLLENVECVSVSELSWSSLLEKIVNPKCFSLFFKFSFKHCIVRVKGFGEYQFIVPEYIAGER